jgi:hypothetical protein
MEYMLILGVGVVCTIAGLAAGYVLGNTRNVKDDEAPEEQAEAFPVAEPKYPPDALHIWRDNTSEKLVLQIGDRTIHAMEPFTATEQKYLKPLLAYLQRWLGEPGPTPTPKPTPQPVLQQQPASGVSVSPIEVAPPETADETAAPKSIVAQIDTILQEKLSHSPLKNRGVRLMESIDSGMTIYIGLESYHDIEDIPDADIVAIIRASVKDWEEQQRP